MTAIALTDSALSNAKRALVRAVPDAKSTHLTEALARACGFATHAALRAALKDQDPHDPDYVLLDDTAFFTRLEELDGTPSDPTDAVGWFDFIHYPSDGGLIRTMSPIGEEQPFKSARSKAWRNAMIAAINTGITRRLFTVVAGDNRWPNGKDRQASKGATYRFEVAGIPALAYVDNAGWDELLFHVALWPTEDADRWISVGNAGFLAGDLFAAGWMERRDGAWLQFSGAPVFNCRRERLADLARLDLRPSGYAESGPFKM